MPSHASTASVEPQGTTGRSRTIRILPVVLWICAVCLILLAAISGLSDPTPDTPGSPDVLFIPLLVAMVTSMATVGALLALRRADNPIGWLMLVGAVLIAAGVASESVSQYAAATGRGLGSPIPDWLAGVAFQVGLVLQVVVVLVFPDGDLPRHGRPILGVVLSGLVLSSIGAATNPAASDGQGPVETIGNLLLVAGVVFATWSLASRLRAARGDVRKQLEWFAWVAAVLAVALTVASLQAGFVSDLAWIVAFGAFTCLPIAIAIAIMKYRLYEIDTLVSRALVYVPLVAILGGVFAAGTALLQRLFVQYTGDTSDAAVMMSTLIVAGTFAPMRKSLEGVVERRYSPKAAAAGTSPSAAIPGALAVNPGRDASALLDDPLVVSRIEEIAARIADEQIRRREAGDPQPPVGSADPA